MTWRDSGLDVRVAINCAPPELMSDIFIPRLSSMLADAGLSPESVVIEVTEDSFLSEPERARAVLLDVRTGASRSRSTTTAPASRRCPTCATCRSTS